MFGTSPSPRRGSRSSSMRLSVVRTRRWTRISPSGIFLPRAQLSCTSRRHASRFSGERRPRLTASCPRRRSSSPGSCPLLSRSWCKRSRTSRSVQGSLPEEDIPLLFQLFGVGGRLGQFPADLRSQLLADAGEIVEHVALFDPEPLGDRGIRRP